MATRTKSRTKQGTPYDPENPSNWTVKQLKEKLAAINITVSSNLSKTTLRQLYLDNIKSSTSTGIGLPLGPTSATTSIQDSTVTQVQ